MRQQKTLSFGPDYVTPRAASGGPAESRRAQPTKDRRIAEGITRVPVEHDPEATLNTTLERALAVAREQDKGREARLTAHKRTQFAAQCDHGVSSCGWCCYWDFAEAWAAGGALAR